MACSGPSRSVLSALRRSAVAAATAAPSSSSSSTCFGAAAFLRPVAARPYSSVPPSPFGRLGFFPSSSTSTSILIRQLSTGRSLRYPAATLGAGSIPLDPAVAAAASPKAGSRTAPPLSTPNVARWLYLTSFLTFSIVVIGGLTRLTESGLSITEWKPFKGSLPPLNAADWAEEYRKYQESEEGRM
jgi:hypothetical protein